MLNWIKHTFELSHGEHRAILPMEGVRGLAVFLVFLVHYITLAKPWLSTASATHTIATGVETMGHLGVDLFFVLSGYLIYGMLINKPRPIGRYAMRRVQRIYPTFAAVFVLYLLLSAIFPSESKIPGGLAGVWYVVQNALLLPGLVAVEPMITVAWSLSYEALCYVAVPMMIGLLGMRSMKRWQRVAVLCVISVGLFVLTASWLGHVRLTMFLCGMLVFEAIDAGASSWLRGGALPALALVLGVTIAMPWLALPMWGLFVLLFVLFFVFCCGCLGCEGGTSTRLFTLAPLRWLGNMSYSYYLIHGLALKAMFMVLAKFAPAQADASAAFWLMLPIAFVATLVPSAVLFIGVEKPYSLARRSSPKPAVSPAQGGVVAGPQAS